MTWVKLDDQWADHPKFVKVGDFAQLMWVKGLTYSARYLLDGSLPNEVVATLISVRAWKLVAQKLVGAGLWEQVDGGYIIHDYHIYQPLREAVLAERALASVRMQRVRSGRRSPEQSANNQRTNGEVRPKFALPDPVPDPDLTRTSSAALGKPGARDPEHCTPPVVPIPEAQSETRLRQAPTDQEPLTPDDSRIRDAIRNLPKLSDLDASDLAQQACAQMLTRGTRLEWILAALQDASDKSQRGEASHVRHARVVGFIRHAKAPKVDEREQKAGPAYREFTFEPGELERIRKVPRRTPLRSPSATETNFQADPVGVPMAEQQERAMALVNGIGRTGGR